MRRTYIQYRKILLRQDMAVFKAVAAAEMMLLNMGWAAIQVVVLGWLGLRLS